MSSPLHPDTTYRTFRKVIDALPQTMVGQVISGRLVVLPRPASPHVFVAGALETLLAGPFQFGVGGPGGWWIVQEPELSLGVGPDFDPIVPDLVGWRRERMPRRPDAATIALVPDWVCEVLSPSTGKTDRDEKMPFYARAGVHHAWLVDPVDRTLEAFRAKGGRWERIAAHEGHGIVRVEPFEAIELDLTSVWER